MATIEKSNKGGENETEAFYKNERKGKTNKIEPLHVNEEKKEVEVVSFHNVENKSENNEDIFGLSVSKNGMDMNNNNIRNPVVKTNGDMEKEERKSGLMENKSIWETEEENLLHDETNLSDEGEEVEEENVDEKDLILQRYKHGTNIFVNLDDVRKRCVVVDFYSECLNKYKNECSFVYYQNYNSSSNVVINENVEMVGHVHSPHLSCENMESMGNMPISNDKLALAKGKNVPKISSSVGMGVGTSVMPGEDFKNFNLQKRKQESLDPLLKCINSLSDRINLQHLVGDPTTYFKLGGGDMFYDINDPFLDDEEMYKELNKTKNEIILTRQIEDEYSVWSADMSDDYVDINPESFISFYSSKCKYVYCSDEEGEENNTKECTNEVGAGKGKCGDGDRTSIADGMHSYTSGHDNASDANFRKRGNEYRGHAAYSSSCSISSDNSVIELNESHMDTINYEQNVNDFIIYSSEEQVEVSSSEDENEDEAEQSEASEEDIIFNPFAWKKFERHIPPEFISSFQKLEKELDALPLEVNIEDIQAIIRGNIYSIFVQVRDKQKNILNHFDKTLDDYIEIDIKQLRWLTTIMNKTSNTLNDIDICRIWFEHIFNYNITVFINCEKEFVSKIKNSHIFEKNNKAHLNGILKDMSSWRSFQEYKEKMAREGGDGVGGATTTSGGATATSAATTLGDGANGPKVGSSASRGASKAATDCSKSGIVNSQPSSKEPPQSGKLIDARDAEKENKGAMCERQGRDEASEEAEEKAHNDVHLKTAESPKGVAHFEGNVESLFTPSFCKDSAVKNEAAEGNCDSVSLHFSNNSTIEHIEGEKMGDSAYSCVQNNGLSKKECTGGNGQEEDKAAATIVTSSSQPCAVAALSEAQGEKAKGPAQNGESCTDVEAHGSKANKSANPNSGQKEEYKALEKFFKKFVDISYDILNYIKMFIKQKCFLKDMISAGFEALVEKHNKHFIKFPYMTVSEILTNLFNFRYKTNIIIAPDYIEALVEFYQEKYKVDISCDKGRNKKVFLFDTNEMHKLNNAYYRVRNSARERGVLNEHENGGEEHKGKWGGKGEVDDKGNYRKGGVGGGMVSNDLLLTNSKERFQNASNKKYGFAKNDHSGVYSAMDMTSKVSSCSPMGVGGSGTTTDLGNNKMYTKKRTSESVKHSLMKETNSLTKKKQNKILSNDLARKNWDKKKNNKNEKKMSSTTHIIICSDNDEDSEEEDCHSGKYQVMTKMANERDSDKGECRNMSMLIENITKKKCSANSSSLGSLTINHNVLKDQRRGMGNRSYVGQHKCSLPSMPSMPNIVSSGHGHPHSTLPNNNKLQTFRSLFSNSTTMHHNSVNNSTSNNMYSVQRKRATEENLLIISDEKKNINSNNMLNEKMQLYKKRKMKNEYPCGKKNSQTNMLKVNKVSDKMKGKVLNSNDKCAVYKCINIDSSDENK
ncbi:hypothetical protein AK88_04403 [Plasmodium fragile]|uniref:Uncharacterized protein n=1 Tax=Plasmodium fragile TaxID=5857 RepID=A0A0D9QG17_PLAFR|nr:uncharacterized protein AK88_04403 [Plasmodium fragile]KJP85928.1 hypothetical protein AK88_04403 [Plasmodium fragile]